MWHVRERRADREVAGWRQRVSVRFARTHPAARAPAYSRPGDAGLDLCSIETVTLEPGARHVFGTGIAVELPPGYAGLVWDRSGLGARGITSFGGVVDRTYRGEIKVTLFNSGSEAYTVRTGDRIAQLLIQPIVEAALAETAELTATERGTEGFGSSGR